MKMPMLAKSAIIPSVSGLARTHALITLCLVFSVVWGRTRAHTHCEAGGRSNEGEGLEWFLCCDALKLNNLSFQLSLKKMLQSW